MTITHYLGLTLLLAGASALALHADKGVTVNLSDGEPVQVPFAAIERINFADGLMHITAHDHTVTHVPLADITNMRFDEEITQTDVRDIDLDNISIHARNGEIEIIATEGLPLDICVYSLAGRRVAAQCTTAPCSLRMSDMDPGVYIIIVNDKTLKYINR